MTISIFFKLLGSLALLMFGMKSMSDALQKMAGSQLRHVLGRMTTNRFTGMLTGTLVTAAVQSSTATTVMTVSFVNAGLFTLAQAISIIMGANIGTTLTAWIMSAGFSFNITDIVYPAFLIGIMLIYSKRKRYIGDFLFGIAFMFLSLGILRQTGIDMNLGENEAVISFFSQFDPDSFLTIMCFLLIGGVLTFLVHSSAAVMAITMILCSSGVLPIYQGIALVMGENIGTTTTSIIVALTANTQARRAAFAHLFFNVFGVVWILLVFRPFVDAVCGLVGYDETLTVADPRFMANAAKLSFVLAAFHTCFNIANTAILIWFIPQIERLACRVIKSKPEKVDEESRLRFIERGIMKTPELSLIQAQKEITLFAERMRRMFGMVTELADTTAKDTFDKLFTRIKKYEGISDNMEIEIARYLEQVGTAHLSDDSKSKARSMMRQISELESIGDACYNLARTFSRKQNEHHDFSDSQQQSIHEMMRLTAQSVDNMLALLQGRRDQIDPSPTADTERQINALRDRLRAQNLADIDNHLYSYAVGTIYTDIINECEKLGDYVINVAEARLGYAITGSSALRPDGNETISYRGLVADTHQKSVTVDGQPVSLTKTEYQLLTLLLTTPGRIFSREELIHQAWPTGVVVTPRTVDVNITRLRKKIAPYDANIVTRSGFGYSFKTE